MTKTTTVSRNSTGDPPGREVKYNQRSSWKAAVTKMNCHLNPDKPICYGRPRYKRLNKLPKSTITKMNAYLGSDNFKVKCFNPTLCADNLFAELSPLLDKVISQPISDRELSASFVVPICAAFNAFEYLPQQMPCDDIHIHDSFWDQFLCDISDEFILKLARQELLTSQSCDSL